MMKISNKSESDAAIKRLALNHIYEYIIDNSIFDLMTWYDKHRNSDKFFNIRDKSKNGGKFLYKLTPSEVLGNIPNKGVFSIYESLWQADQKLILQGDIQLTKDFRLTASLDDRLGISNRIAMQNPHWSYWNHDLLTRPDPNIRGFKDIIAYICQHELFDVIVEFSLYEIPIGMYNEPIIIWELRNY